MDNELLHSSYQKCDYSFVDVSRGQHSGGPMSTGGRGGLFRHFEPQVM